MKFIADSMLGRLARWLRLLGHDTVYYPSIEDRLLLKIAREEDRVLLTRDTRLVKVRGIKKFLLLEENDPFAQLRTVITAFNLDPLRDESTLLSRCPVCNCKLEKVLKEEVKGSVPEYVYHTSDIFKHCPGCGKIYWKGTHPERFRKKLLEIIATIKPGNSIYPN